MKKLILILALAYSLNLQAQVPAACSELFISTYVEGGYNNKAIQVYNPSASSINLNQYWVGRFQNGEALPNTARFVQLPNMMLAPYQTYTAVIDKRNLNGTGNEYPVWAGNFQADTLFDAITGDMFVDGCGNAFVVPQDYVGSEPVIDNNVYFQQMDLAGRADGFFAPDYNANNSMYWNGNDAVVLYKGANNPANNFNPANVIDVIGVIGEDPGQAGWLDAMQESFTTDVTIKRKATVTHGTGIVFTQGNPNMMDFSEWLDYARNTFCVLDYHDCNCDPSVVGTQVTDNVPHFKVFPNPASGMVQVLGENNIARIEIYNLLGQASAVEYFNGNSGLVSMNIEQLNAGLYLMHVIFEGDARSVQKLSVN